MNKKGVIQADIASSCGVSQAAVSGWMNGSIPRGNKLIQLSSALGASPGELLGESIGTPIVPREYSAQNFKQMYLEQKSRADHLERELKKITAIIEKLKGTSS